MQDSLQNAGLRPKMNEEPSRLLAEHVDSAMAHTFHHCELGLLSGDGVNVPARIQVPADPGGSNFDPSRRIGSGNPVNRAGTRRQIWRAPRHAAADVFGPTGGRRGRRGSRTSKPLGFFPSKPVFAPTAVSGLAS
jgi:hypothetical protein